MRTSVLAVRVAAVLATLLGLLLAVPAAAQQMTLEPSAAVACMTPAAAARSAPEYPFEAYKREMTGHVKVALKFTAPGTRPVVTVLAQDGDSSFLEAVEDHVRAFRVPCHDGGNTPMTLIFTFVFRSDHRKVYWSPPTEGDEAQRNAQLACIVHTSGDKAPEYPRAALRADVQGRVLVRLRYDAPDQPPVVEMLPRMAADASVSWRRESQMLSRPIEHWVAGYRMPCHQGKPITTVVTFTYRIGDGAYGFKPGQTLQSVLPMVRDIRKQRLSFDFNRMGCPFDVYFQYRQPRLDNRVGELGTPDPARQPFLAWLAQAEFDLPGPSLDSIYGDSTRITVPCLKIDLNPTGVIP